ncbi:hypothetical protein PRUPE_5G220800 [Prunus persica]|uniref:Endonuclease/exonuclease/phosphatase domain-containing protein n=1 Tax=Prunus persica TaxID=3760 RepID=A0A251PC43_PRUPE|nr:hypothetical protein PRUPE_5G220800 [Prunus persica]
MRERAPGSGLSLPATLLLLPIKINLWLFLITFWVLKMHPSTQICTIKSHPDSWSGAAARSLYGRRSIVIMLASCVYRFSLLHQENIEFQSFGLRNNVAQLCVLKSKQNQLESEITPQTSPCTQNRSVVIGNTHVLFNPNRGDIKLGQVRLFLEKAHELSQEWGSIPVIISGDLNSIPQSPMYQFLASSELDIRLHNRRHISGQVDSGSENISFRSQNGKASSIRKYISRPSQYIWNEEEVRLATGIEGATRLQHHLKLCSAYLGVPGSCRTRDRCGEPLATSYHSKFMGTVDYIWHTEELVPVRVLETLPVNILRRNGGLPSKKWGSDHLALVCELAFRK